MAVSREKAERIESCPYCDKGYLARDPVTGVISCNVCGAYFEKGILYRNTPEPAGAQLFRLRKWQQRIRVTNAAERNLAFAMSELDLLTIANSLPRTVKETASKIYRKAVSKNLVRGRSIESIGAASVYSACRICGVPRTIDEIAETSHIGKKELGKTYRFLARELKLNIRPAQPQDYVQRYGSALKLSENTKRRAISILDEAAEKELMSGLGPSGISAAAIYIAANQTGERRSQREVSLAADISEVTLRCRYKKLSESLGIELDFS